MTPTPSPAAAVAPWQQELQQSFREPAALAAYLGLDPCPPYAASGFAMRVPLAYAQRMRRGDPRDPLLRQVWPSPEEMRLTAGYAADPVGDLASLRQHGVLHKYHGRALVMVTGACAVHCRYCFRRHFPYAEHQARRGTWQETLSLLQEDPSLHEVILSGGDPLSLHDDRLAEIADDLARLPHLRRLRIHTRQPVVVPSRVDPPLLQWLTRFPRPVTIVLHVNHAQEIDDALRTACTRLRDTGATLLNQAVLLRGVNDQADLQQQLSEALFDAGVLPYYLHRMDRVQGGAHFDVGEDAAAELMRHLQTRLPGYLLPRLVREDAGAHSKTLLY